MNTVKIDSIIIAIGALLALVGILGRLLTGTGSITALIPLFFGAPIIVLGLIGRNPDRTRLTLAIVLAIALLGTAGSANVLPDLLAGSSSTASILSRGSMLVLCVIQLIAGTYWFLQNRKSNT